MQNGIRQSLILRPKVRLTGDHFNGKEILLQQFLFF